MLIFDTLEIEKTKDKLAIKEAYLKKLSKINLEDKPQEFMKLRSSYEDALAYADSDDIEPDNNPIDIWISKVNKIYDDFESRNNQDLWRNLLKDDVCQSIDTKNQAREALLVFFMENNNIYKEIFILLNDYSYFMDDLDELYEEFPKLFIDNIIVDGINNKEYPPYDLFEMKKGLNYDKFLEKYYELERSFSDDNLENIKNLLEEIDKLNINHLYLEINRAITYYKHENINQAWDIINNIDDKCQELIYVKIARGNILVSRKEYEMAKKYFENVIKIDCNNYAAIKGLCGVYIEEGKLLEAKELIYDLNSLGYQNIYIDELSNNINDMLIKDLDYQIKNNT